MKNLFVAAFCIWATCSMGALVAREVVVRNYTTGGSSRETALRSMPGLISGAATLVLDAGEWPITGDVPFTIPDNLALDIRAGATLVTTGCTAAVTISGAVKDSGYAIFNGPVVGLAYATPEWWTTDGETYALAAVSGDESRYSAFAGLSIGGSVKTNWGFEEYATTGSVSTAVGLLESDIDSLNEIVDVINSNFGVVSNNFVVTSNYLLNATDGLVTVLQENQNITTNNFSKVNTNFEGLSNSIALIISEVHDGLLSLTNVFSGRDGYYVGLPSEPEFSWTWDRMTTDYETLPTDYSIRLNFNFLTNTFQYIDRVGMSNSASIGGLQTLYVALTGTVATINDNFDSVSNDFTYVAGVVNTNAGVNLTNAVAHNYNWTNFAVMMTNMMKSDYVPAGADWFDEDWKTEFLSSIYWQSTDQAFIEPSELGSYTRIDSALFGFLTNEVVPTTAGQIYSASLRSNWTFNVDLTANTSMTNVYAQVVAAGVPEFLGNGGSMSFVFTNNVGAVTNDSTLDLSPVVNHFIGSVGDASVIFDFSKVDLYHTNSGSAVSMSGLRGASVTLYSPTIFGGNSVSATGIANTAVSISDARSPVTIANYDIRYVRQGFDISDCDYLKFVGGGYLWHSGIGTTFDHTRARYQSGVYSNYRPNNLEVRGDGMRLAHAEVNFDSAPVRFARQSAASAGSSYSGNGIYLRENSMIDNVDATISNYQYGVVAWQSSTFRGSALVTNCVEIGALSWGNSYVFLSTSNNIMADTSILASDASSYIEIGDAGTTSSDVSTNYSLFDAQFVSFAAGATAPSAISIPVDAAQSDCEYTFNFVAQNNYYFVNWNKFAPQFSLSGGGVTPAVYNYYRVEIPPYGDGYNFMNVGWVNGIITVQPSTGAAMTMSIDPDAGGGSDAPEGPAWVHVHTYRRKIR